ncbi:MAG TPA: TraM recognition domain-containing protein, partial [bacterium]|nr:TraM recognition domain-containing protein [bacterium]
YFVKRDRRYDFFDKSNPGHIYLEESKFFNFKAVTIVEVYNWMSEFELKKNLLKYVSESRNTEGYFSSKIFELARYFEKTLRDDEGHLSGMISMISPLISEKTRNFFASPEPFDFVDAINKGKIIIVNVPEGSFGTISKLIGLVLLLQMQKTSLKRLDSNFKINRSRFIFIILDEVQKFMCSELANFPSVSRQAKVCNMYLHQSLGQIPEQYIDDLYGNTLNKVILYVRDNRTAEYVSQNFGEKTVLKETTNESKQGGTVRQGQVFAGSIKSMGKSFREEKERRFTAHDIVHLKRNRAIISMSDGSNILESFMVDLLPFYMNDIFPVYHFIFKFDKPLEKQTTSKMKAVLENTARNVNAEFKRFSNGDNAVYFMFAFRKPVDRKFVDTIYSGIKGGLVAYGSTAGELFQGDLDTVIDKKAEAGII